MLPLVPLMPFLGHSVVAAAKEEPLSGKQESEASDSNVASTSDVTTKGDLPCSASGERIDEGKNAGTREGVVFGTAWIWNTIAG